MHIPDKNTLDIIDNVCIFLILIIPIIWTKWIYNENQRSLYKRLRPGFFVLFALSIILYLGNHFIAKQNEAEQRGKEDKIDRISRDLKSLTGQLPANGFMWDSTKKLLKSLYANPIVVFRDTTNYGTDVVLCATDQMKLEIKDKEMDSIWITANFCTTRGEVQGFSIMDRILIKKDNNVLVSRSDRGIVSQNWRFGTYDYSLTKLKIEPPYSIRDTIIYYCKFNWLNKEKGMSESPQRLILVWDRETNLFGYLTNPFTIDAVTQSLKHFDLY
jgi:hypothetical protein